MSSKISKELFTVMINRDYKEVNTSGTLEIVRTLKTAAAQIDLALHESSGSVEKLVEHVLAAAPKNHGS